MEIFIGIPQSSILGPFCCLTYFVMIYYYLLMRLKYVILLMIIRYTFMNTFNHLKKKKLHKGLENIVYWF